LSVYLAGLENGSEKTWVFRFKKPLKTPEVLNLGFIGFPFFW